MLAEESYVTWYHKMGPDPRRKTSATTKVKFKRDIKPHFYGFVKPVLR